MPAAPSAWSSSARSNTGCAARGRSGREAAFLSPPAPPRSPGGRGLPAWAPGLRVGLFGGSFDPPHEGHRLAALTALRRLRLDRVWWLVTPGNPLKRHDRLPSLDARIAAARRLADHPRIAVTGIEAGVGLRFTADTVHFLRRRCPGVRFVWVMGADNLSQLPRWRRWRDLVGIVPVAVVDRPGSTLRSLGGRAAAVLAPHRLPEAAAALLPGRRPPAFVFLHGPRSAASSTALRDAGRSRRGGSRPGPVRGAGAPPGPS